jgi:hypothetical protein
MGKEGEFHLGKETSFLTITFCVCGMWFLLYYCLHLDYNSYETQAS